MRELIFGHLTWQSLPHEWFTIGGTLFYIAGILFIVILLTWTKRWKWLWKEWLTTVDPKKIGIMYFIVAGFMLLRGGLDAIMIWLHQALAGSGQGFLTADHFQQIFTAHGNIMVFFVAMGFVFGLINYIVPLQIGARDLASPFLNTLGFWLYVAGVIMVNIFFVFGGEYAATGWLAVAPLSSTQFSPGPGMDYLIWSLQISGIGTTLGAINFIVTILKMRAPGMTLRRMPLFTWGSLCSMIMAVTVFPLLTATLFLLAADRSWGTHFFTTDGGGNAMMYTNLIWMWGHPEVYILMLPCFGIFSEVVQTFSQKKIASYTSAVLGMIGVATFSMAVWLHHFFTMGAGADVNAFFGLMTMVIGVPTAALVFNWVATMYKGRIRFTTPMLWFLGFAATFGVGGLTGIMLAAPPADFQLHNSLFLVAHFHTMVIGGVLWGIFAGISYWFPKIAGFRLNERIGRQAFWCWLVGFWMAFGPLYILGFMGATRRLDHYDNSSWQPFFVVAFFGGLLVMLGVVLQVIQIIASFIQRKELADNTGDPWNARTLEWSTPSPAPYYNFRTIPTVNSQDPFWDTKQQGIPAPTYEKIHMPKNIAAGICIASFAFLMGFGFVWHITWLIIVGIAGMVTCAIVHTFKEDNEYTLPAAEVKQYEQTHIHALPNRESHKLDTSKDMSIREFVAFVITWSLNVIRNRKWRTQ